MKLCKRVRPLAGSRRVESSSCPPESVALRPISISAANDRTAATEDSRTICGIFIGLGSLTSLNAFWFLHVRIINFQMLFWSCADRVRLRF